MKNKELELNIDLENQPMPVKIIATIFFVIIAFNIVGKFIDPVTYKWLIRSMIFGSIVGIGTWIYYKWFKKKEVKNEN